MKFLTIENFYQSKEWKEFRSLLIEQRSKEDGLVICEYCGQPIFGSGQIVAHHLTELTEDNVNNPRISLNPDNIALVHLNCHNNIHHKYINTAKEVILLWGPPCSYFKYIEDNVGINDIVVSLDYSYKAINPQSPLFPKTRGLTNVAFKIRNQLLDIVKVRAGNWQRAYVAGGYPTKQDRARIKDELGIEKEVFFDMDIEEAKRIARGYGATQIYEKYIDDWYETYNEDIALPPWDGELC